MSEKNYVLNVKTKAGTIFTVRGDTYVELMTNINQAIEGGVEVPIGMLESSLFGTDAMSIVTSTLGATPIQQPVAAAPGFAPVRPPATAPVAVTGGSASRQCIHGEMTKREGSGQWGPYKAYYCPTPKGTPDQCKPIYIKPNDADWATF